MISPFSVSAFSLSTPNLSTEWPSTWIAVLAHSLWVGSLLAVTVALLLRRIRCERPDLRCGLAYSAMVLTVIGSILAATLLPSQLVMRSAENGVAALTESKQSPDAEKSLADKSPTILARATSTSEPVLPSRAISWQRLLVGVWLTGVAIMMLRLGRSHVGAYRLVQRSAELPSDELIGLLDEVAEALAVTKRVSLRVSDAVAAPLIYGVVNPTILMPVSFVSGVPAETLRVVLGHELWHLRRGDLIWGHGQRLIESLLFYHPAIWWLSRQVDCEREAACDLAAARMTGQPGEVAKALLDAAEHCLPQQTVAYAFADQQLPERVQRLVKSNSPPRLRVWWGGLLGLALLGFIAVAGLTAGTGLITQEVAAALTPSERIEAIETAVAAAEEGTTPPINPTTGQIADDVPRQKVTGQFVAGDGSVLPDRSGVTINYRGKSASLSTGKNARFESSLPSGVTFYITPRVKGFAPTLFGPYQVGARPLDLGNLWLEHGYKSEILVTDEKGEPLEGVAVDAAVIWTRWSSGGASGDHVAEHEKKTSNADGIIQLSGIANRPIGITLVKPGYQRMQREETFQRDGRTTWQLEPSQPLITQFQNEHGKPVAGVELYCVTSDGDTAGVGGDPREDFFDRLDGKGSGRKPLAVSDSTGTVELSSLKDEATYWFMALHAEYAPCLINSVRAGDKQKMVTMKPPLVVCGVVLGDKTELLKQKKDWRLFCNNPVIYRSTSYSSSRRVKMDNDGHFEIRQLLPGRIFLTVGEHQIRRQLTESISDLVIDLDELAKSKEQDYRSVRLKLVLPDGQPVRGVVQAIWSLPSRPNVGRQQRNLMLEVPEDEPVIEFRAPIGANLTLADGGLIGAIPVGPFNQQKLGTVPPGEGAYEQTVSLRPAGLVTGQVVDSNGTPLPNSSVTVRQLQNPFNETDDELSSTARFAIGKLPFDDKATCIAEARVDGTWQFVTSKPFKITEAQPLHDATLTIPNPVYLTGRVLLPDGTPAAGRRITMDRSALNHSYSASDVGPLDDEGRFRIAINPIDAANEYAIHVEHGRRSTGITLKYQPNSWGSGRDLGTVNVGKAGTIRGVVVTPDGSPLANMKVEASPLDWEQATYRRNHYTETDNEGGFLIAGVELKAYKLQIDFGKRAVLDTTPELTQESDILGNPTLVIDPEKESGELRIVVSKTRE